MEVDEITRRLKEYEGMSSAYRVFVLHSLNAWEKTQLAEKVAETLHGMYIDFLMDKTKNLSPKIGLYSLEHLKRDIAAWSREAKTILVLDEIEALFDTWSKDKQKDFFRMIFKWRPESIVLICTIIDMDYEDMLGKDRVMEV